MGSEAGSGGNDSTERVPGLDAVGVGASDIGSVGNGKVIGNW